MTQRAAPAIASLVPHAGPMCLLGAILDWDTEGICCEATIAEVHPLHSNGRLPATALIEYAAQAMAAHGRLVAADADAVEAVEAVDASGGPDRLPTRPRPGRLVGLRATELNCRWVAQRQLRIEVRQLGGDPANVLYGFDVLGVDDPQAPQQLASGRAVVTLEAES